MALFSRSKKTEEKKEVAAAPEITSHTPAGLAHILMHPRITEKATMHESQSVYTFDVAKRATKRDVMRAVQTIYKVMPRLVRVVNVPTKVKRNMRTGRTGTTGGGKKAYVYLKKGETITIS